MNNQVFGSITIVICAIGYYFSWKHYSKNYFKSAVILLVLCGLALRVFTSLDFFLNTWDERYHALVAKNLLKHPFVPTLYDNPVLPYNYSDWTSNHVWLHKPPLPLWIISLSFGIFGVNEISLRIPSIVFTTLGITLTYSIGKYFFNRSTGYIAAFFYSINGLIIELTAGRVATDHTDIFFLFFIELSIFLAILFARKKNILFNILCGISIGLAVLSKWLPALIVLPIWLLIIIDSGNYSTKEIFIHFLILICVLTLTFLPWQVYIYMNFHEEASWEANYNFRHLTETLDGRNGSIYYYLNKIRVNYGELIYLPIIYFFWRFTKGTKNLKRVAVAIWFLIPFIFFSIAKTKMQGFILFSAPALFLMTADFWLALSQKKDKSRGKLKWLIIITQALFILIPFRYAIERIKPFEKLDRNPAWVCDLKKSQSSLNEHAVLLNYPKPIEAMFYTNATVYKGIPDDSTLVKIAQAGFDIFICNIDQLPERYTSMRNLKIIKLSLPKDNF
jgi:4-amino-4-deoxy-L-arabinose transferase-like glycosyltransferase